MLNSRCNITNSDSSCISGCSGCEIDNSYMCSVLSCSRCEISISQNNSVINSSRCKLTNSKNCFVHNSSRCVLIDCIDVSVNNCSNLEIIGETGTNYVGNLGHDEAVLPQVAFQLSGTLGSTPLVVQTGSNSSIGSISHTEDNIVQTNLPSAPPLGHTEDDNGIITVLKKDTSQCSICIELMKIGETIRILDCMHRFHKDCVDPWLGQHNTCPECRES